jgi:hypothetical protein
LTDKQEEALHDGVCTARVITLPNAHHYVFLFNQAYVLREIHAFLTALPD